MKAYKILLVILIFGILFAFVGCGSFEGCQATGCNGCNQACVDQVYRYDEAIIKLPDGTIIRGKVQQWNDYEGDQIQVKIDGVFYLAHMNNVVLIAKGK